MQKRKITRLLKRFFLRSGLYLALRKLRPHREVSILRYHAVVSPDQNTYTTPTIALSPAQFEQQVAFFARHYQIVSLPEVLHALSSGAPLPPNAVVFTFDDGYADNLEAARILHRYQASGTFFLTVDPIDRQEPFWLAEITHLILTSPKRTLQLQLDSGEETFLLYNRSFRWKAIRECVRLIKSHDLAFREAVRCQVREQLADRVEMARIMDIMLSWEQVKEMQKLGMHFGSHTLTHLNLPNANPEDAKREITESRGKLARQLNVEIEDFSYPNSGPYQYFNERIRQYVAEAGYRSSCTSEKGFAGPGSDLLALRRVRTVPQLEEILHFMEWERVFNAPVSG